MICLFDTQPIPLPPTLRGRAAVARRAHNPKVTGSIPVLATNERNTMCSFHNFMQAPTKKKGKIAIYKLNIKNEENCRLQNTLRR